jgi:glutamate/tyrosine decarboxylase-like PLP-dependent enzyme
MLERTERSDIFRRLIAALERCEDGARELPITSAFSRAELREVVRGFQFEVPCAASTAFDFAVAAMERYHVHNCSPRYFGLFVPAPSTMGVVAEALTAAFNPALGAWHLSPIGVEIERHLIEVFAAKCGFDPKTAHGSFTTGGAEANHTAIVHALTARFPEFRSDGMRALRGHPVLYASAESHHSLVKAARLCGLGDTAVRRIPVDAALTLDVDELAEAIAQDRARGLIPFLVAATFGTTNAATIDNIAAIGRVARKNDLWLHVDAAWGGAAILLPELRTWFDGVESADSITLDAHKWLSVPIGAGMYLTRHAASLARTFAVDVPYMPDSARDETGDPYMHSMQWSRRFTGLKLFLTLAVHGWEGYRETLRQQIAIGNTLRARLALGRWRVVNRSPLPVVCFIDEDGADAGDLAAHVVASGRAWISRTSLTGIGPVLRACVTNFRTDESDLDVLLDALGRARAHCRGERGADGA